MRLAIALGAGSIVGGCAAPSGPHVLAVPGPRYSQAFDAAVEVARRHRMDPALRDRRSGVIETDPVAAPSILEPWRAEGMPLSTTLDQTVNFERRRARFEFIPVGFDPSRAIIADADGPHLLPLAQPGFDLTTPPGELELRVTVTLERAYNPTLRHDDWTLIKSTNSTIILSDDRQPLMTGAYWTTIGRDELFERLLLGEISRQLEAIPAAP